MIAEHLPDLEAVTSLKQACELLGANRSTIQRRRQPPKLGPPKPRPAPPNKLTEPERQHVLSVLRSEEYCDLAPAQVWARLLDDGIYLCSISTMYRLVRIAGENCERRRQRTPRPCSRYANPARKLLSALFTEYSARAPSAFVIIYLITDTCLAEQPRESCANSEAVRPCDPGHASSSRLGRRSAGRRKVDTTNACPFRVIEVARSIESCIRSATAHDFSTVRE